MRVLHSGKPPNENDFDLLHVGDRLHADFFAVDVSMPNESVS